MHVRMSKEDNYYYSRLEGQLQYLRLVQTLQLI